MRIVNPCYGLAPVVEATPTDAIKSDINWRTDPVAIISNSKPNARELLEGVRSLMAGFRDIGNIDYHAKTSASYPASDAMNADIAARYKGAILALAD